MFTDVIEKSITHSGFSHNASVVLKTSDCVRISPLTCRACLVDVLTWLILILATNRRWQTLLTTYSTFVLHFPRTIQWISPVDINLLKASVHLSYHVSLMLKWDRSAYWFSLVIYTHISACKYFFWAGLTFVLILVLSSDLVYQNQYYHNIATYRAREKGSLVF